MGQHLQAIATRFSLVNPAVCAMMFAGIVRGERRAAMMRDASFVILTVAAVLTVAAFAGAPILKVFGISLDAFSVAGGGVLIFIGLSMLGGKNSPSAPDAEGQGGGDNRLGPLILFAASPGTITGVMTIVAAHERGRIPVTTIVAFRRHTLLPLDHCIYALQPSIPNLTRSSLHRCLQRHGISALPDVAGDKPKRQKFKRYPIGFFHIDIAEMQTAEGKLYLFVGIDRTSKFAVTQVVEKADRRTAWEFLQHMLKAVPYHGHTILTDNGIQFSEQPRNRNMRGSW